MVADEEGDLEFVEIERHHAIVKFSQTKGEDGELVPANEILEQLQSDQPELLIIDRNLTLPKASGGTSDPVLLEVQRRVYSNNKRIREYEIKVAEVQKRIPLVNGGREIEVL